MSITSYFTQLKTLWQELDNFRPIPSCLCEIRCTCPLVNTVKSYREDDYVIRFLRGLNEQYTAVKSQIMLMRPLPDISDAYSMLIQQERGLNGSIDESRILANVADNKHTGKGHYQNRNQDSGSSVSSNRGHYRNSRSKGKGTVCSHCGKTGHTVDVCYKKHGFPPNYKRNAAINNCVQSDDDEEQYDTASMFSHRTASASESSSLGFTPAQHKALLALLQQPDKQELHSANQITSMPCQSTNVKTTDSGLQYLEDDWFN